MCTEEQAVSHEPFKEFVTVVDPRREKREDNLHARA